MVAVPKVVEVANATLPLVGADQVLSKAAEVMLATRSLGVVTVDVKRRPMLVLTFRTLVRAIARGAGPKERISVYAVDEPVIGRDDMTVVEALALMRKEAVRFLPIVDARNRLVATFEPYHAAQALWEILDYGDATVEARLRRLVALPADATVRVAAKAMDENGVPEILVRYPDGTLRMLREEDFLRAVAEEKVDEAKIGDYARGQVIRVPAAFDAKSAVELMLENGVRRLMVEVDNRQTTVVTLTDLAFEAAEILDKKSYKETGFVLVKTEVGRELDIANRLILEEGIKEVYTVTGDYDVLVRVEAPSLREIYKLVLDKIRKMPGVVETKTMAGVRIAAKED